jgi:antirestriction protein ArdC
MTRQTNRGALGRERLDAAIDTLLSSEGWRAWVTARGRFRRYSLQNSYLIAAQAPEATYVAGYRTWRTLGRAVRRGERAIRIYAPVPIKPDPTSPDAEGRVIFRAVPVFDLAQTDPIPGAVQAPLVPPCEPVAGDSHAHLIPTLETLACSLGYRVVYEDLPGGVEGSCDRAARLIRVAAGFPANGRVAVLVHELGHAYGVGYHTHPRSEAEVIVEAAAHITCTALGLDTTGQAVPYIAEWAGANPREAVTQAAGLIDEICAWFDQHLNPSEAAAGHAGDEALQVRCAA